MKKILIDFLSLTILFCMCGCSKSISGIIPDAYPAETAIKNGDVVKTHNGTKYNSEKLDKFMADIKKGKKTQVRITRYTTEGGAVITDLKFDGRMIAYTNDTTRDGMGVQKIEKKKYNADSLQKNENDEYYIKTSSGDISIY